MIDLVGERPREESRAFDFPHPARFVRRPHADALGPDDPLGEVRDREAALLLLLLAGRLERPRD